MDQAWLQQLRIAINATDGPGVLVALGGVVRPDVLQLGGDGLVIAAHQQLPALRPLLDDWVAALRERFEAGDVELADHLEASSKGMLPRGLTALAADLEELSMVLETGEGEGGLMDRASGEVWPRVAIEYANESDDDPPDFDDPERWLYIAPFGSGEGYRDMRHFISSLSDPEIADRLAISIEGRGAFRRFKDTIGRWSEVQESWYLFSADRQRGRAREWLAEHGYCPCQSPM